MMTIVIDAISLVKFCIIDIKNLQLVEWVRKDFDLITSPKVYQEGRKNIECSDNQEAQSIYHRIKDIQRANIIPCESYVTACLSEIENGDRIDEGEKTALSLAMRTAITKKEYILFITDDYKALGPIKELLCTHGIGVAESGFYMLRQIGMLNSAKISVEDIEIASRSLQNELRDNNKPSYIEQKPDRLLADNVTMINRLRGKAATRHQCRK